jgi:hypothetical protein
MTPTRRAVLKAAVAGGAFAVPLVASFSMDAASASTRVHTERTIVSNMFCSNQSFVAPTGFFSARLPGHGSVLLGFFGGFLAELAYELTVRGDVKELILSGPYGGFIIENPGKFGTVRGSEVTCGNELPPEAGLATLFEEATAGELRAFVELSDGTGLSGTFTQLLDPDLRLQAERQLRHS